MSADTIAIILGRGGSAGLPDKNLLPILGRPMMEYAVLAALHSEHVERIFITTDDEGIASVGRKHGCDIIDRPPELCTDEALFEDALVHGYQVAKSVLGKQPEYVVILMCNAPMITSGLIDAGIEALEKDRSADSAVTISTFNMWSPLRARSLNDEGYLDPFVPFETFGDPATLSCDRDSLHESGSAAPD